MTVLKADTDPQKERAVLAKAVGLKKMNVYVARDSTATFKDSSGLYLLKEMIFYPSGYLKEQTIYHADEQVYYYDELRRLIKTSIDQCILC